MPNVDTMKYRHRICSCEAKDTPAQTNNSALQKFSAVLKTAFPTVAAARAVGEPAVTDFVSLREQADANVVQAAMLLSWHTTQLRMLLQSAPTIRALPADATLIQVVVTAAAAGRPIRGRPPKAAETAAVSPPGLGFKSNYDGRDGFTPEAMVARTQFLHGKINRAASTAREDILEGAHMMVRGLPDAAALAGRKQSRKQVHVMARSCRDGVLE